MAGRLGELTAVHAADVEPDGAWAAELARKVGDWRRWLWQVAEEERTGILPAGDDAPEHPPVSEEDEATLAVRERISREDAPAMLLVGLVRSGVHVGNAYLRGFFHARPASRPAAAEAEAELAERDEDKIALDSAVKAADGFFTTFFVSPYSRYIARWCARHGLTPNQMTTVSMGMGLVAAALFALGSRPGLVGGRGRAAGGVHDRLRRRPARAVHAPVLEARGVAGLDLRPRQGVRRLRRARARGQPRVRRRRLDAGGRGPRAADGAPPGRLRVGRHAPAGDRRAPAPPARAARRARRPRARARRPHGRRAAPPRPPAGRARRRPPPTSSRVPRHPRRPPRSRTSPSPAPPTSCPATRRSLRRRAACPAWPGEA